MTVRHLFARLIELEDDAPVAVPELPVPIQGELSVGELERLAARANQSIRAMELQVSGVFKLVPERDTHDTTVDT